ncbi:MAG: PHB depolymerase family esterase [Acidobacteriota bacterium]
MLTSSVNVADPFARRCGPLACLWLTVLGLMVTPAWAAERLPRGILLPKVVVAADTEQSYALYVPSGYDAKRPNTVLICFDPSGLGSVPVELFRETAEIYDVLVAGSNVVRSGEIEPALRAADTLWKDLDSRFNVDPRRVYLCGFSGGAAVATEIALAQPDLIAGVIACGGVFSSRPRKDVEFKMPLALIAGSADFNRLLLEDVTADLSRRKTTVRLWIPSGSHEWPKSPSLRDAWEWLEQRALRDGRRPADPALARRLMRRALARAGEAEQQGRVIEAYTGFAALANESPKSEEGMMAQAAAKRLGETAEYKAARQRNKRDRERETEFVERVRSTIDQLALHPTDSIERRQSIAALGIESWRKEGTEVARRSLERVFYESYERGISGLLQTRVAQGLAGLGVAVAVRPDGPLALYNYACALARHGEKKEALKYLKRAVETGRFAAEDIQRDEDFISLRDELEYKQLVRPQL